MAYVLVFLGVGLLSSLLSLSHFIQENALLKERLHLSQIHLDTQNAQIKALELDTKAYKEQKLAQEKAIKERYKITQTAQIKTCQEKLNHIERLLNIFKDHH
ncbi:hypothetical protein [Helicobacter sp. L8]|uniref:hypothetical protein n=1 Tax=Helicobacter sp. L8 TaxID=2316078 RepID=UPI000EAC7EF5|nr:hypothetical protein [Helicobacter sp. L8]